MAVARDTAEGLVLNVRVVPRSERDEIVGVYGEALKIRINAPPVDGKANDRLARFLSTQLEIPASRIKIIRGMTSREKQLLITGIRLEELWKRMNPEEKSKN
jgi:uncharacterized protein (TIGR00251 family)